MNCEGIDAATNLKIEQLAFAMEDALGRFETFVAGSDGYTFLLEQIAAQQLAAADVTAEQLADCLYAHLLERDSLIDDDDRERLRALASRLGGQGSDATDFAQLQENVRGEFGGALSQNRAMTLSTLLREYLLQR